MIIYKKMIYYNNISCFYAKSIIHKLLIYLFICYTNTMFVDATEKIEIQNKLNGSDNTINKSKNIYSIPLFYTQVGIGLLQTNKLSNINDKISASKIPLFYIAFGFYHQFYIHQINLGYKLNISYEVGIKSFSEDTISFKDISTFLQTYIGYKQFLLYVGIGYDFLNASNSFISNEDKYVVYSNHGIMYGGGINIITNRYSAVDINIKLSKTNLYEPRFIIAYEIRF